MDTPSGGIASAQFPLDRLHLCWLLPFSESEVLLPHEDGEEGLKTYPHLPEFLWDSSEEEHHLSDPISLSDPLQAPPPASGRVHPDQGRIRQSPCQHPDRRRVSSHPAGTQTEGLGYHPSFKLLWKANQARVQLEYELIQETQELAERCEHK